MTFNRAMLIILTPVDWCNLVHDVVFDDDTIHNVTLLDKPTKGCVLENMAVEKDVKVVRVAVL